MDRRKGYTHWIYLVPFLIFIIMTVLIPLIYTFYVSFTNMSVYHWTNYKFIGLKNYYKALLTVDSGFLSALFRTLLWTALNIILLVFFAFVIALGLNSPELRFKNIYKTLLIFPWAMPAYVTILLWRMGMFNTEFGFLNQLIRKAGWQPINFLSTDVYAFLSCMIINLWLGIPYMFTMIDAAMQSIDRGIYENAYMEGAGFWRVHVFITAPMIAPILTPILIMTAFTNFKQFDIVYLMTMQTGSKTGANIHTLITYVYDKAFVTSNYGYSAAVTGIISLIIIILYMGMQKIARSKVN
ncbi:sugar ABC transporter permease [Clostridiales bacterium COT073_COT-073]|nr:sugar ABC transporter permease [Clostridiales bacterium COT073_COT-073]